MMKNFKHIFIFITGVTSTFYKETSDVTFYDDNDVIHSEPLPSKIACAQKAIFLKSIPVYDGLTCKCVKKKSKERGERSTKKGEGSTMGSFKIFNHKLEHKEPKTNGSSEILEHKEPKACKDKEWTKTYSTAPSFKDIELTSAKECKAKCKEMVDCYQWVYKGRICELKALGGKKVKDDWSVYGRVCKPDCKETEVVGENIKGAEVGSTTRVSSREGCERRCRETLPCLYWQLRTGNECRLRWNGEHRRPNGQVVTGRICPKWE